jgi:hypothetical protein
MGPLFSPLNFYIWPLALSSQTHTNSDQISKIISGFHAVPNQLEGTVALEMCCSRDTLTCKICNILFAGYTQPNCQKYIVETRTFFAVSKECRAFSSGCSNQNLRFDAAITCRIPIYFPGHNLILAAT